MKVSRLKFPQLDLDVVRLLCDYFIDEILDTFYYTLPLSLCVNEYVSVSAFVCVCVFVALMSVTMVYVFTYGHLGVGISKIVFSGGMGM